jgi:membrane-associated phospholipid phosphatase
VTGAVELAGGALRGAETVVLRAVRPEAPALRRTAAVLSASASRGRVWAGLAGAMAVHPRLRPAGRDGLLAWAAASGAAFGVKAVAGRRRPRLVRAFGAPTRSSSMPSSHTAGAVAFAGAAALRAPVAGLVAAPLAAGVAWSRAATGRHFPTDVVAGAALGAAAAVAVHLAVERLDTGGDRPIESGGAPAS